MNPLLIAVVLPLVWLQRSIIEGRHTNTLEPVCLKSTQ